MLLNFRFEIEKGGARVSSSPRRGETFIEYRAVEIRFFDSAGRDHDAMQMPTLPLGPLNQK